MGNGKTADAVWTALIGILFLAILFVMVRPGSVALQAVKDVTGALAALIETATGSFGGSNG